MVFGIGVDCVEVRRMAKSMEKPHFAARVFSEEEQALLGKLSGQKQLESAAACFAAKEAFLKAVGQGLGGFILRDIGALRHNNGAPYYHLTGGAAEYVRENGLVLHLSLTHEGGMALAFAVAEQIT